MSHATLTSRLTVTNSLRLGRQSFRDQIAVLKPALDRLDRLDLLAYDAGGVGDAVGELLPIDVPVVPIVTIAGTRPPARTRRPDEAARRDRLWLSR